ncbi:MAG: YncE family protein [Rhodanobacteraceae bacterium]
MKNGICSALLVFVLVSIGSARAHEPAQGAYRLVDRFSVGGQGGWDDLSVDPGSHRLFISRSDRVIVLDANSGKSLGVIPNTAGVHGIALAPGLGRGYTSNGHIDSVTEFDLATLKVVRQLGPTGKNPDAILYDPFSRRVFTFNGHSDNASVIDARSGKVITTIPLDGKPEFAVSDGAGRIYVNIEDKAEITEIDSHAAKALVTWPLTGCEEPSGLAIDIKHRRLFSVCQNHRMVVVDAQNGHVVATLPIGAGPDGAGFDAERGLAFSSNGRDGTLTVVHEDDADHYRVLANTPTQKSARTMTLDPTTHRIYLSAATFGPMPAGDHGQGHKRPPLVPDSFTILVVGREAMAQDHPASGR